MLPLRLLSFLFPIRIWRGEGRWGPLEIRWEEGRLVLNGPRSNQSFGSLRQVWRGALRDLLPRSDPPASMLMLGFGTGSAAWVLRKEHGLGCPILGVEADPLMVELAHAYFNAGNLPDLRIVEQDALTFVATEPEAFELVLIDLFHDLDLAPGVEDADFIRKLAARTAPQGLLLFNTVVHDAESRRRSEQVGAALRHWFGQVAEHRYEGLNHVFEARSPKSND